jgi:hypothetical protein
MSRSPVRSVDLHLLVETIVEDERVSQRQSVRLHGMTLTVVEVPHVRIVEIRRSSTRRHLSFTLLKKIRSHTLQYRSWFRAELGRKLAREVGGKCFA